MSQHYYKTRYQGNEVTVMLGYDRPLGHVFMVIERTAPDENDERDGYAYSNLDEPDAFGKDLAFFRRKLQDLGITVPDSMFEQVELDRAVQRGNRQAWYGADGTFTEDLTIGHTS